MKKFFSALISIALAAALAFPPADILPGLETVAAASSAAKTAVSAPKATKASGTHYITGNSTSISVTFYSPDALTTVYYSLNGAAYKKYTSAIKITKTNSTLKAYAQRNSDGAKSSVVTYNYKIAPKVTFSSKSYSGYTLVTLNAPTCASLFYTTDGSTPTSSSKRYDKTNGIKLTSSCKLRVLATAANKTGMIFSKSYTVTGSSSGSTGNTGSTGSTGSTSKKAYTSADKRFSVNVGEAELIYDGKRVTGTASRTTKGKYDCFEVSGFSGDSVLRYYLMSQCVNQGDTVTDKDIKSAYDTYNRSLKDYFTTHSKLTGKVYDYGFTTEWLDADSIDGQYRSSLNNPGFFKDVNITWEYEGSGAATASFSMKVRGYSESDPYGISWHTLEGFFAVNYKGLTYAPDYCPYCRGKKTCMSCTDGYNYTGLGSNMKKVKCTKCSGTGACPHCNGTGKP